MVVVELADDAAHGVTGNDVTAMGATVGYVVVLLARHTGDTAHIVTLHADNRVFAHTIIHNGVVGVVVEVFAARVARNTANVVSGNAIGVFPSQITILNRVVQNKTPVVVTNDTADIISTAAHYNIFSRTGVNGTEGVVTANATDIFGTR